MTTATEVLTMLKRHYAPPPSKPPGGRLLSEIQAPNSLRRADALYLPITTADRGKIIGHEIKVSRSDVVAELRDPHKADSWLRYCSRWWLVIADPKLVAGLDIPPSWGILAPPKGTTRFMTVLQKAPPLTPDAAHMTAAWGTIFARTAYSDIADEHALERARREQQTTESELRSARAEVRRLQRVAGEEVAADYGRMSTRRIADIVKHLEHIGGYNRGEEDAAFRGLAYGIDDEDIARGILAAHAADDLRTSLVRELGGTMERGRTALKQLDGIRKALGHE